MFFLHLGLLIQFNNVFFQEHLDYEIVQSLNPEFNKAVIRVNVFKEHRQTIQVTSFVCTLAFLLFVCNCWHYWLL